MSTLFCKWPSTDKAKAEAYHSECSKQIGLLTLEANASWGPPRADKYGLWTVALLAPPWAYLVENEYPEPESCLGLRADAIIVEVTVWADEG